MSPKNFDFLSNIDTDLQDKRNQRLTVYLDPDLVENAQKYIGQGENEYGTMSVLVDTAIRRQVLHELQRSREYAFLLEELPSLPGALARRVPDPGNASPNGTKSRTSTTDSELNRRKKVVSARTNGGVYLLMKVLIEDPDLPFETESALTTEGLRRLLP